jgi:hypothetical protein
MRASVIFPRPLGERIKVRGSLFFTTQITLGYSGMFAGFAHEKESIIVY